eukprot:scaffold1744_cov252-Pinguiococcus_pyrenoidosus.AAC.10
MGALKLANFESGTEANGESSAARVHPSSESARARASHIERLSRHEWRSGDRVQRGGVVFRAADVRGVSRGEGQRVFRRSGGARTTCQGPHRGHGLRRGLPKDRALRQREAAGQAPAGTHQIRVQRPVALPVSEASRPPPDESSVTWRLLLKRFSARNRARSVLIRNLGAPGEAQGSERIGAERAHSGLRVRHPARSAHKPGDSVGGAFELGNVKAWDRALWIEAKNLRWLTSRRCTRRSRRFRHIHESTALYIPWPSRADGPGSGVRGPSFPAAARTPPASSTAVALLSTPDSLKLSRSIPSVHEGPWYGLATASVPVHRNSPLVLPACCSGPQACSIGAQPRQLIACLSDVRRLEKEPRTSARQTRSGATRDERTAVQRHRAGCRGHCGGGGRRGSGGSRRSVHQRGGRDVHGQPVPGLRSHGPDAAAAHGGACVPGAHCHELQL